MTNIHANLYVPQDRIAEFWRRHHIRELAFFGSVLREDLGPASDIDVFVDFEPAFIPGLSFFTMERELSEILGRKVDLNTVEFIGKHFRDRVLEEAEVLYVSP